jgi:hypothetical protein
MANVILWSLVAVLGVTTIYFWFVRRKDTAAAQPQQQK